MCQARGLAPGTRCGPVDEGLIASSPRGTRKWLDQALTGPPCPSEIAGGRHPPCGMMAGVALAAVLLDLCAFQTSVSSLPQCCTSQDSGGFSLQRVIFLQLGRNPQCGQLCSEASVPPMFIK